MKILDLLIKLLLHLNSYCVQLLVFLITFFQHVNQYQQDQNRLFEKFHKNYQNIAMPNCV